MTESWGQSIKDSKGEVDMSKEGRGRGRGGKTLHSLNILLNYLTLKNCLIVE